jgi:8-oxo-dGTP pyrophosphatase MutT (NUDIX family)
MSCGIILVNKSQLPVENNLKVLMVRRKDSMAYTEFLRGKYDLDDPEYIRNLLSNMTSQEHQKLQSHSFEYLWRLHWGDDNHSKDYESSIEKFGKLDFSNLLKDLTSYTESEWGFPKGRRSFKETDLDCAIREFGEETDISREDYIICSNLTLKEVFTGTNGKPYEHLYFIGLLHNEIDVTKKLSDMQKREISAIEWKSVEECRALTRPHYIQRTELLNSLERLVKTFNTTSPFLNKR